MADEPEVYGLLALMLLHDSRREARLVRGDLIPLAEQDRSRHDQAEVEAGRLALNRALALRPAAGPYVLQAAIASLQAEEDIDWHEVTVLYERLERLTGSPVVTLNRAVLSPRRAPPNQRSSSSNRSSSASTATSIPPEPSCCAVSAATTKPGRRFSAPCSWPPPTWSVGSSPAGCPSPDRDASGR
jgi:hypothetical protein